MFARKLWDMWDLAQICSANLSQNIDLNFLGNIWCARCVQNLDFGVYFTISLIGVHPNSKLMTS